MNILIIGNGGREHALAWKAVQSSLSKQVFIAPGNAGTALEPNIQNIDIASNDIPALLDFAQKNNIGLTIVGPEEPLAKGIVDVFRNAGLKIFGPTKAAAQLEASKLFAKDFLVRHKIPTAKYRSFTDPKLAIQYIHDKGTPIVIKANGLAAGKGVIVAMTNEEAEIAIHNILTGNAFGDAGHCIVVEEFLDGEEVSFIVMVDSKCNVLPIATSQDHKRVGNGDTGLNTGGMGAYSPAPIITSKIHKSIMNEIIWPTVYGMAAEGNVYTGFLYAGLIINQNSQLKVIEFNCRFGDPEAQPIMLRLHSDLIEICLAACDNRLDEVKLHWDNRSALGVILAASGYPSDYRSGDVIHGLSLQNKSSYGKIFHAGTKFDKNRIITNGGRVLCVTALGRNIVEAQRRAYKMISHISCDGSFYRYDIGYRAINRNI